MSFADYWSRLQDRNPKLRDDDTKVTLTARELRRLLQQAYDRDRHDNPADDLFKRMTRGQ